jgi:AraC-like DNA-binding protein
VTWETAYREPHARLRAALHGGYVGWVEDTDRPQLRRELPFPGLPLILSLGPAFRLSDSRNTSAPPLKIGSFVAGLDDWYTVSESPTGATGVQVNFTPYGASRILGIPLELLTRRIVPLADLLGAEGRLLESMIGEESTWDARFAGLEEWLLQRLDRIRPPSAEIEWIWRQFARSGGTAEIGDLTRELGWSRQRMVNQVRRELGMAPKLLSRIVRFDRVTRRVRGGRLRGWSALAVECGYHDQAHLIREVREFAGCTPTELPGHLAPVPEAAPEHA